MLIGDGVNLLGFTPTVMSDIATIYVEEPNLGGDATSAVNQTFTDLLRYNPTEQQLNNAVTEGMDNGDYLFNNNEYLSWAAKISQRDLFQNMVDAIAGYHTMVGLWLRHPELMILFRGMLQHQITVRTVRLIMMGMVSENQEIFFKPSTSDDDPSAFPSSAFDIATFVDDTLSSETYTDMHGPVPALLGDDRFEDYAKNRQNFTQPCTSINMVHRQPHYKKSRDR